MRSERRRSVLGYRTSVLFALNPTLREVVEAAAPSLPQTAQIFRQSYLNLFTGFIGIGIAMLGYRSLSLSLSLARSVSFSRKKSAIPIAHAMLGYRRTPRSRVFS